MDINKALYSLKKIKNMCMSFDDKRDVEALDFCIERLEGEAEIGKLRIQAMCKPRPNERKTPLINKRGMPWKS